MEFIFDIDVIKALNIYLVVASSFIENSLFHCFKPHYQILNFYIYLECFLDLLSVGWLVSISIPEPCCFNYCHFIICLIMWLTF